MDFLTSSDNTEPHSLLELEAPAYSKETVKRAFIVWLRCGQQNDFRIVCKYYHHLEAMENQLLANVRNSSRELDLSLFTNPPPTCAYQQEMFPYLYPPAHLVNHAFTQAYIDTFLMATGSVKSKDIKKQLLSKCNDSKGSTVTPQEIFDASQVFKTPADAFIENKTKKLEVSEFLNISAQAVIKEEIKIKLEAEVDNGLKENLILLKKQLKKTKLTEDAVKTSQMIKNFCKNRQVSVETFLEKFKEHATRCEISNTVTNLDFYIKRQMIHGELTSATTLNRNKHENATKIEKKLPTLTENNESLNQIVQSRMKLVAKISQLNVQDDIALKRKTDDAMGDSEQIVLYNGDLISFEDDAGRPKDGVTLLREGGLKPCTGFSSSHNIETFEAPKYR